MGFGAWVTRSKPASYAPLPILVCPEGKRSFPCCIKDERRSLGFGNPMLESNHPVRLLSRAVVVSDEGKGCEKLSGAYDGDERK